MFQIIFFWKGQIHLILLNKIGNVFEKYFLFTKHLGSALMSFSWIIGLLTLSLRVADHESRWNVSYQLEGNKKKDNERFLQVQSETCRLIVLK